MLVPVILQVYVTIACLCVCASVYIRAYAGTNLSVCYEGWLPMGKTGGALVLNSFKPTVIIELHRRSLRSEGRKTITTIQQFFFVIEFWDFYPTNLKKNYVHSATL